MRLRGVLRRPAHDGEQVRGRFEKLQGIIITAADPLEPKVTATVDLSGEHREPNRDNHIEERRLLRGRVAPDDDVPLHGVRPDGENFLLDGELTIRETTRPVTLKLEVNGFGLDAYRYPGLLRRREINRHYFRVSYGLIPGGGVAVSEKVTITIEAEGVLNKPEKKDGPGAAGLTRPCCSFPAGRGSPTAWSTGRRRA